MTAIVLAAALLLASPSVVAALSGRGSVDTALWHLALALLVSAVAGKVVRAVVTGYERAQEAAAAELAAAEAAGDAEPGGVPLVPGARRRDDR
ncbi:hypothetical protein [Kineococcus terrestris]|uniref:hypothetical protein n=1 Tax=Kineococcus terrestris TaxID=2044856 RepID=UPI0034DB3866